MMDYITIYKEDKTSEQMEIVATCESKEFKKKYIIYKTINNKYPVFYAASYKDNFTNCELDTNLSLEEKKFLEMFFEEIRRNTHA